MCRHSSACGNPEWSVEFHTGWGLSPGSCFWWAAPHRGSRWLRRFPPLSRRRRRQGPRQGHCRRLSSRRSRPINPRRCLRLQRMSSVSGKHPPQACENSCRKPAWSWRSRPPCCLSNPVPLRNPHRFSRRRSPSASYGGSSPRGRRSQKRPLRKPGCKTARPPSRSENTFHPQTLRRQSWRRFPWTECSGSGRS